MHNDCTFIGNMGKDPETHNTKSGGTFTTFSMAVNKPGADRETTKPLWLNVACFGKTSEIVSKYMKQGNTVLVQGAIEVQEYEGKDGKNHTSIKVLANKVTNLSKKSEGQATAAAATGSTAQAGAPAIADDDIPF